MIFDKWTFILLILLILIEFIYSLKTWDFKKSAKELPQKRIIIYENIMNGTNFTLIKSVTNHSNYLSINDSEIKTDWEGIDSSFDIDGRLFICPKGKYYLLEYKVKNLSHPEVLKELKPDKNFSETDEDWDLKCHYYYIKKTIAISFLNKNHTLNFFYYNITNNKFDICMWDVLGDKLINYKWIDDLLDYNAIYDIYKNENNIQLTKASILTEKELYVLFHFAKFFPLLYKFIFF